MGGGGLDETLPMPPDGSKDSVEGSLPITPGSSRDRVSRAARLKGSGSSTNLRGGSSSNLRGASSSRNLLRGDLALQSKSTEAGRLMRVVSSLYTSKGTEEDKALASAKLWQISTNNRRKQRQLEALHCPPHQRTLEDLKVIETVCKDVPLLEELDAETKMKFLRAVGYVYWPEEGTFVYKQGEKGDAFYCVLSGSVAVVTEHDDTRREMQVGSHRAGETFGELALIFPQGTRHASIRTVQPCEFLRVEKADYDRILRPIQDQKHNRRLALISRLAVFRHLPRQQVQTLSYYMSERVAAPGQVIARQGDEADSVFIIQKGEARVVQAIHRGGAREGSARSRAGSSMSFATTASLSDAGSGWGEGGGRPLRRNSASMRSPSRGAGLAGGGGGAGGVLRRSSDGGLAGSRRGSEGSPRLRTASHESLALDGGRGGHLGRRLSLASSSRREGMRVPVFGSAPPTAPDSPSGGGAGAGGGEDLRPEESSLGDLPSPPPGGSLRRGSFAHGPRLVSSRERLSSRSAHTLGAGSARLPRRGSVGGSADSMLPPVLRGPEMSARSLRRRSSDVGVRGGDADAGGRHGGGSLSARGPSSRSLRRGSLGSVSDEPSSAGGSLSARSSAARSLRGHSFGSGLDEPSSAGGSTSRVRYVEVATFKQGEFFGHVEAVAQEPYRRSLVSSTGCEVLVLSRFEINRRLDAASRDELRSLALKTSHSEQDVVEDEGTLQAELKKTAQWERYKARLLADLHKNKRPVSEGRERRFR